MLAECGCGRGRSHAEIGRRFGERGDRTDAHVLVVEHGQPFVQGPGREDPLELRAERGLVVAVLAFRQLGQPDDLAEAREELRLERADREKRATILTAEGEKQAAILTAEGEKQAAILRAQGQREAVILSAEGQAKAIDTVFKAIHEGKPDPQLLAYQYLQMLPQIASGDSNKVWIIPSEFQQAIGKIGGALGMADEKTPD